MQTKNDDKIAAEIKLIAGYILKGFSNNEIANKLNYSKSTINNRINVLFNSYRVKTRSEFVIKFCKAALNTSKQILQDYRIKIKNLKKTNEQMNFILTQLIKYKSCKEKTNLIIDKVEKYLNNVSNH